MTPLGLLDGIRVLDLGTEVSGPFCAKLLADYGADVIKVELPGVGDPARRMGPFADDDPHPEKSIPFLYINTNKRGVTLDTRNTTGRGLLDRKSTRLNSSHKPISYAVFCLKKKTTEECKYATRCT